MRFAILVFFALSSVASAHVLRDGANHHLGDDSFFVRFGRAPTTDDSESLRMHVHLQYVHDLLAAHAATRPELEARRAELLGYLDDYIAKGITPENTYVARRNPVFIDRDGNICAVGYLIERSIGRALPETIAATHRLDYLEDIAAAMPAVSDWVASSGFTLEELASIQPGYPGPEVMHLTGWLVAKTGDSDQWQADVGATMPPNGKYLSEDNGARLKGKMAHGRMVGTWTRRLEGKLVGKGTFTAGAGTWKSFRADGSLMAEGAFANNHANGEWTIFHPSGRIAAIGKMHDGKRDGVWTFFYDNKAHGKLARGKFLAGETIGGWKHFDAKGNLVATASGRAWAGLTLVVEPGADGVRHEIHQGIPAESYRMDGFYLGKDKLYVLNDNTMYDGNGNGIFKTDDGWTQRACKWSKKRKRLAAAGDASGLHDMILKQKWTDKPTDDSSDDCDGPEKPVSKARAKHFETMIASRAKFHAPIPKFDVDPEKAKPDDGSEPTAEPATEAEAPIAGADNADDMATYLASNMTWYIEWPHVDDTFRSLYRSLPGYGEVHGRGY